MKILTKLLKMPGYTQIYLNAYWSSIHEFPPTIGDSDPTLSSHKAPKPESGTDGYIRCM